MLTSLYSKPRNAKWTFFGASRALPKRLVSWLFTFLIVSASEATLISFKFSKPIVIGDVVICVEVGSTRAVSVSTNGKTLWRKTSRKLFALKEDPIALTEGPGGSLLVQRIDDNQVFTMDPRSGRLTPRFSLGSSNDVVCFDPSTETLFAQNSNRPRITKVLDSQTGRVSWETSELNGFVGSHASELFIFSGPSRDERFERKLISNEIQSISRTTGKITWKRSVPVSCYEAVLIWPYLVLEDNKKITILAADTGALVRELDVHEWVIQIMPFESQLVYTTRISKSGSDEDMILHFCSLPELKEQKKITLKERRPGTVTFWRDFIITDEARRTVCFRMTGEKVWEKGLMDRTDVIDGKVYFTDNPNDIARIGMIDVLIGVEHILHTERW